MTFRAKRPTVVLKSGKTVPLNGSLLLGTRRPSGGWSAKFRVKGIDHEVRGRTANEVAREAMSLHKTNGVDLRWEDVWLNLNLQWMERMNHKYFNVLHAELTSLVMTEDEKRDPTLRVAFAPEDWGSIAWKWLGLFLAQDHYDKSQFLEQLERVLEMLNPSRTARLGCVICFTDFSAEMQRVRAAPPQTKGEAQRWLCSYHNEVNKKLKKRVVSFEEASRLNFWV